MKPVAPMTGSGVEVRCEVGQAVTEGDVLRVIESMKMNNEFRAPVTGTVETVAVKAAQRVEGEVLPGEWVHAARAHFNGPPACR